MKPFIVLVPVIYTLTYGGNPPLDETNYRIPGTYINAINAAGGIPLLTGETDYEALTERADGIVFTGGVDIDPAYFHEETLNDTVQISAARDALELKLFALAAERKIPIIGICRGIQLINVALGGSLWQDIPSQCPESVPHSAGSKHTVTTVENSVFRSLFGAEFRTNSYHHQAVKVPGKGLRVTARAEDGTIEALEHETLPIWATQWHPERMCAEFRPSDLPPQEPFFEFFVRQCAERKG